ncbi:MAG TPA: YtxH domain-containing protein [Thermoanaerobaculia bacterium]|jgi:gas vesicle protein
MFSRKQKFPLGKVAIGFGIGAFVGAVLALLYAPVKGKELQKKIANVTENLIDQVEERVDDVQATVRRIAKA